jgi:N-acetylglucosaminyldiphosphoundecaprenol N-acetyl-beta-D-mannosaminyltransferase
LPWRKIDVAGVLVDEVTEDDVIAFVRERVKTEIPARIATVNAEYVVRARDDATFAGILREADLAAPDGAGVVWAMRRQGSGIRLRVGGSDLIWSLSGLAEQEGLRVFLLGAKEGVAVEAAKRLRWRFPGLEVAGTYAGSPSELEEASIVHLIRQSRADILFVAFGAPAQDVWIARNVRPAGVSVAIGVGGTFDYLAGTAHRAPVWMRERGLEWLWRLLRQPWRWRRMLALPRFVWLVYRSPAPQQTSERIAP